MSQPICPVCGDSLDMVDYYIYEQWKWDPENECFKEVSLGPGTAEVKCSHCDSSLDEEFPEGPVNWGHPR